MNITIFDMDWLYKKSFMPNINCMRLSSYHKQKGDNINFITQETHLCLAYDILYISREKESTPMPSRKLIDDKRTKLLGAGFKMYGAKELGSVVVACRPDYLLYDLPEHNAYANANFITFYAGGKLIKNRQDYHNTLKHHKKTIVTDKYFWKATDKEIIFCLEELKKDKNIVFLEPISLGKLIRNTKIQEKFLELHFSSGTIFKWKNDYSSSYPEINNIISFMQKLHERTRSDLGTIPIKTITANHINENDFDLDMLRLFQIIAGFKHAKIKCVTITPQNYSSPWYNIIEQFENWTKFFPQISYVEYVLHDLCKREAASWDTILNNPIKWKTQSIDNLLRWLTCTGWTDAKKMLFVQWGEEELNSNKIDYNKIKANINLLYKDIEDE